VSARTRRRSSSSETPRCDARVALFLLLLDFRVRLVELGVERVDLALRGAGRRDRVVLARPTGRTFLLQLLFGARRGGFASIRDASLRRRASSSAARSCDSDLPSSASRWRSRSCASSNDRIPRPNA